MFIDGEKVSGSITAGGGTQIINTNTVHNWRKSLQHTKRIHARRHGRNRHLENASDRRSDAGEYRVGKPRTQR